MTKNLMTDGGSLFCPPAEEHSQFTTEEQNLIAFDQAAWDRNEQESLQQYGAYFRSLCGWHIHDDPNADERSLLENFRAYLKLNRKETMNAERLVRQRILERQQLQQQELSHAA